MNLINLENFTKAYEEKALFNETSFTLDDGEKVGIIGVNGTGKSTLLKILTGLETVDSGKYTKANNITISFLSQNPQFKEGQTALESVMDGNKTAFNEWSLEAEAKSMMLKLGITDFSEKTAHLSGGQRKRVALCNTLLSTADVLILDEPTNHLDAFMAEWLENYLKNFRGALIMVTHDRYFLDAVCNRIVEIDKGKIYSYKENYLGYLRLKAEREEAEAAFERKIKSLLRVELAWMQRGAEARRTKQKSQIKSFEEHSAIRFERKGPDLQLSSISSRMGKTTVELENITKKLGEKQLISDFTYLFLRNDRVGFVGENGCGKTTLMKIISGELEPDEGTVNIGQTIKIGYYKQELLDDPSAGLAYMDPRLKVIDYIRNTAEYVQTEDGLVSASVMLDRFLFPPAKQYVLLDKLSGGERRRLNLLRVLMEQPNVLILDEPTNDLDITTMTILEDFLDSFDGIVITVSHDRYFLDRVVNRIFAFENGTIKQYEGGYTEYLSKRPDLEEAILGTTNTKASTSNEKKNENADEKKPYKAVHQEKLKFSYKEQKEYETIDEDIQKLEEQIADLESEILKNATDFGKLRKLTEEKEEKETLLSEKMDRWVYLTELAEKIEAMNS